MLAKARIPKQLPSTPRPGLRRASLSLAVLSVWYRQTLAVGAKQEFEVASMLLPSANLPGHPVHLLRLQTQIDRQCIASFIRALGGWGNRSTERQALFAAIRRYGITAADLHRLKTPDLLYRNLDPSLAEEVSEARGPDSQENLIPAEPLAIAIHWRARDRHQGLA